MELALSEMISRIDRFAEDTLGIPVVELMRRSGAAVARAVRELTPQGGRVLVLAGKGNNGGDGYAAACELLDEYSVAVADVFSAGQRTDAGRHFRAEFLRLGGAVLSKEECLPEVESADCLVDAIFGTGFSGELPESIRDLAIALRRSRAKKIAVDIPLGLNADTGELSELSLSVDITVALSYLKVGLLSFPARGSVGSIALDTLGIDRARVRRAFSFNCVLTDAEWAASVLPKRDENGNKGSFGRVLLAVGSDKYRGAAHLASEAALRAGVGYVTFAGLPSLAAELRLRLPELLFAELERLDADTLCALSSKHSVTLIGSGSECTAELAQVVRRLISMEGGPLVLDADAINALSLYGGGEDIRKAKRTVILTPHPLELSRLTGLSVSYIQEHRLSVAKAFALENSCTLLLKGAATVVTDGTSVYVNGSGSSALAKAGSGDVLAGLLAALLANVSSPVVASALAAYLHGSAGDDLAKILSVYGVIPSDLPRQIARTIADISREQ